MSSGRPEDEDELDDLDDLLDDFAEEVLNKPPGEGAKAPPPPQQQTQQEEASDSVGEQTKKTPQPRLEEDIAEKGGKKSGGLKDMDPDSAIPELDEDFAAKLKLGMDEILGEMENDPEAKKTFEALMAGMAQSTGAEYSGGVNEKQKSTDAEATAPKGFQDTISRTMNRLKESGKEMDEQQSQSGSDQDFLAKMMKELENASGENVDMSNLLDEMLQELSSKEILYEPMKEMNDKYPEWIRKNEASIPKEDLDRYKNQMRIVKEICDKFEDPAYSDEDEACRKYISERMEQMQKAGAPPNELMGDLTSGSIPGFDFNDGGVPKLPDELENCNVQ
ncbi:hypothetical protein TRICI_005513 [Trichomonascus ciferrii]|uniref:Uncharacterized protein n=1 Tax=Trichomonascus ciferrii TaxID=44093 RepID=A0A642US55_9ASCO|nr:hypothetical protein TRICI_005513 [Trichomonascus ciferrii]